MYHEDDPEKYRIKYIAVDVHVDWYWTVIISSTEHVRCRAIGHYTYYRQYIVCSNIVLIVSLKL